MEVISETALMDGMKILNPSNTDFIQTLRTLGFDGSLLDLPDDMMNEPVEILLNLAKSGEIDPWGIDIVEVTDKFLNRIEEMKLMDLRISGRTLLYAAILLRMKSTWIVQEDVDED
jgi:segregation and condensation protein A